MRVYDISSLYPTVMTNNEEKRGYSVMTRIEVSIITQGKHGNTREVIVQVNTLLEAVRFILGYKPIRGHKVIETKTKEVWVLV